MVKIKTKKQFTLPQLIEYIFKNELRHKWKDSDNTSAYVQVYDDGQLVVEKCTKDSIFTVEVEEEITEDAELYLIERFTVNNETYYTNPRKMSINASLESAPKYKNTTHFYIENDDRELILIWRDGKLI